MNINNINVNKYPVSQVFDPDSKVIFEIPKYQREYSCHRFPRKEVQRKI